MSFKNSSKIIIFASAIIGVTVLSMVSINYVVDKISKKETMPQMPPINAKLPKMPSQMPGMDDRANFPPPMPMDEESMGNRPMRGFPPHGAPPPGYDQKNFQQRPPFPQRGIDNAAGMQPPSRMPPGQNYGNPGPNANKMPNDAPSNYQPRPMPPMNLTPEERKQIEDEIERRRKIFENMPEDEMPPFFPPPGEYPPDFDGYDEDYEGYEGKMDVIEEVKTVDIVEDSADLYEYEKDAPEFEDE